MTPSLIVTLTGVQGCGKTTVCGRAAALARSQGWQVAGLLTLPRRSEGRIVGLDAEDVRTGERLALAEEHGPTDGPSTERWHFHRRALEWGSACLNDASPSDLLILDELGPLELVLGLGWVSGVTVLEAGRYLLGIAVVRPSLLPLFRSRLSGTEAGTVVVETGNRDQLPDELVARLARSA